MQSIVKTKGIVNRKVLKVAEYLKANGANVPFFLKKRNFIHFNYTSPYTFMCAHYLTDLYYALYILVVRISKMLV